jgi:hypothetical protein
MDLRTWHCAMANSTDRDRHTIIASSESWAVKGQGARMAALEAAGGKSTLGFPLCARSAAAAAAGARHSRSRGQYDTWSTNTHKVSGFAKCEMRNVRFRETRNAKCDEPVVAKGLRNAKCEMSVSKREMRNVRFSKCEMRNVRFSKFEMRNAKCPV